MCLRAFRKERLGLRTRFGRMLSIISTRVADMQKWQVMDDYTSCIWILHRWKVASPQKVREGGWLASLDGRSNQYSLVYWRCASLPEVEGHATEFVAARAPPTLSFAVVAIRKKVGADLPEVRRSVHLKNSLCGAAFNKKINEKCL